MSAINRVLFLVLISIAVIFTISCDSGDSTEQYRLTISLLGDGSGSVTSTPAGINCGSDCIGDFDEGTVVQLDTIPDSESKFSGWYGSPDCSDGSVTMNADISCSAQFDFSCDPISQNCLDAGDGCYPTVSTGNTTCAVPSALVNLGQQGDDCSYINACDIGYGCMLDSNTSPSGLSCAKICDTANPGTTCSGIGDCVQVNQYYVDAGTPDSLGMCVDCTVYTCP